MRERFTMSKARLVTAAELERSPEYERYELVEGRLVPMTPVGYEHARVVARLIFLLQRYLEAHPIGEILPELGVRLASDPDTVLGPDVAFIDQRRLQSAPRGFWPGAPDVAIEVLSPEDRPGEVKAKVDLYLTHGVPVVAIVDPHSRIIRIHRPSTPTATLREGDVLDLEPAVPGFRCTVADIFPASR